MAYKTYYTAKHLLSKGALFNFVESDRSDGKTFDIKTRTLYDKKEKGLISIYMRRFKSEIDEGLYSNFFGQVLGDDNPEKEKYRKDFEGWEFKGSRKGVQCKRPNSDKWEWIVFFVPLTMSGKLKSTFDSYVSQIETINFDEYIPLDDRYAHNEMTLLLEFWKSIDRDRDKVQLIILGNRLTPYNPFCDYFNLSFQLTQDKIRTYRDGTLAIQIYSSKEHRAQREKSKFSKLVEGTEYDEYNAGGVLYALNLKVASHVGCSYFSSFKTSVGEGTIWSNGRQFIISSYKRKDGFVIVDKMYNTGREEYMINFGRFTQLFKRLYKTGQLYFEDEMSYHIFEDILRKVWN